MADVKVYEFPVEEKRSVRIEATPTLSTSVSRISIFKRLMNFLTQEKQSISINEKKTHVYSTIYPSVRFNINR